MNWNNLLSTEQQQEYFQVMLKNIADERAQGIDIYPSNDEILTAFSLTPFAQVKVVILGQDPYHGEGQAHGLSFSVKPGIKVPPSLANMYKELVTDIEGFNTPNHGCLTPWAKQGVLLLNTVLTVQKANAHSHAKLGWERYTDKVIELINQHSSGVVFMLWGSHAQKKGKFIDTNKHFVLSTVHPSPLSAYRGFFGCKHFSKANKYLISQKQSAINWQLDNIDNEGQISLL
ncbi:uracil-DNA glycosylase [Thalassotalea fonticola]|uniref:Uracil-DNA glycosylase n=1 Tax=Thalassotalea fonticola TaxID=3065649 RepID=A0ABZ0GU50_9GAMM|nr:uracil-DNA glycosylase [Colwelliaceae bacterium S1-1]